MWKQLKNRKLLGDKFLRKKPLLESIVDFYCRELKLVIEIDGASHEFKDKKDKNRQKQLEKYGIIFVRMLDEDVKKNPEVVATHIRNFIKDLN